MLWCNIKVLLFLNAGCFAACSSTSFSPNMSPSLEEHKGFLPGLTMAPIGVSPVEYSVVVLSMPVLSTQ